MEHTEDIEEIKEAPQRKGIASFAGVALPGIGMWEAYGTGKQFALAHKLGVSVFEIAEEIKRRALEAPSAARAGKPAPGAGNGLETLPGGKGRGMTKAERDLHIMTLPLPSIAEWDAMEIMERYDHVPPGGYTPGDVRWEIGRRAKNG